MRRTSLSRWLRAIALAYALVGTAAYLLQDRVLFPSEVLPADHDFAFPMSYRELTIPYADRSRIHIVRFTTPVPRRGVVLYLHGNRRNIARYARHAPFFTRRGYEVWMVDYPGYGKSTGPMEERVFLAYALQAYRRARVGCGADSLLIYGRSLGTGVAAWLAARVPSRGLVLETPYYSIPALAASRLPVYPWGRMLRFRLETGRWLAGVRVPVTVFHGTSDGVIPYRHAARLRALLKPGDVFVTVPGGRHNDLEAHAAYRSGMDSLLGAPVAPQ